MRQTKPIEFIWSNEEIPSGVLYHGGREWTLPPGWRWKHIGPHGGSNNESIDEWRITDPTGSVYVIFSSELGQ